MHHQDPNPSTAAILGHPVHPMLVPIPIGALSLALVTDVLAQRSSDRFWPRASRFLLGAGAIGGAVAAPSGTIDFLTIPRARELPQAWLHAGGNLAVLGLTVANLALRRGRDRRVSRLGLGMSALGAGMLAVTGWLGGELSFRHRIGVAAQDAQTWQPEVVGERPEVVGERQIDAFGGRSAIAVPIEVETTADATAEGRSGGG